MRKLYLLPSYYEEIRKYFSNLNSLLLIILFHDIQYLVQFYFIGFMRTRDIVIHHCNDIHVIIVNKMRVLF